MKNTLIRKVIQMGGKVHSYIRLIKRRTERVWVEENEHIHALNYWWYKWFTNSYRNFLLENFRKTNGGRK